MRYTHTYDCGHDSAVTRVSTEKQQANKKHKRGIRSSRLSPPSTCLALVSIHFVDSVYC